MRCLGAPQCAGVAEGIPVIMSKVSNKQRGAVVAAAVLAIAVPVGVSWEGEKLTPYKDPVGIWTVCSGATDVPMRPYTKAECWAITLKQYAKFRDEVAGVEPRLKKEPWQWAAYSLFASNVGTPTFAKSSILKLYREGRFVEACRFLRSYKYAGGKVLQGLIFRRDGKDERIGEVELCLVGAVPAQLGLAE